MNAMAAYSVTGVRGDDFRVSFTQGPTELSWRQGKASVTRMSIALSGAIWAKALKSNFEASATTIVRRAHVIMQATIGFFQESRRKAIPRRQADSVIWASAELFENIKAVPENLLKFKDVIQYLKEELRLSK